MKGGLVVERRMPSEVVVIVDIAKSLIQEVFSSLLSSEHVEYRIPHHPCGVSAPK
jgi:hypothetical protein